MLRCSGFVLFFVVAFVMRDESCCRAFPSLDVVTMKRPRTSSFYLVEDDQEVIFGNSGVLDSTQSSSASLMESLQKRQDALQQGIGKRYVTRTQLGFLNVHYEPTNPHDTNNVVGRLQQGQIVTSTGPMRGFWIPHDGGGWSISKYGGFTWLEPIDE